MSAPSPAAGSSVHFDAASTKSLNFCASTKSLASAHRSTKSLVPSSPITEPSQSLVEPSAFGGIVDQIFEGSPSHRISSTTPAEKLANIIHILIDRGEGIRPEHRHSAEHTREMSWRYHLSFLRFDAWHVGSALLLLCFCIVLPVEARQELLQTLKVKHTLHVVLEPAMLAFLVVELWLQRRLHAAEKRCTRMAIEERLGEVEMSITERRRTTLHTNPNRSVIDHYGGGGSIAASTLSSGDSMSAGIGSLQRRMSPRDGDVDVHFGGGSGVERRQTPPEGVPRQRTNSSDGTEDSEEASFEDSYAGVEGSSSGGAKGENDGRFAPSSAYLFDVRRPPSQIANVLYKVEMVLLALLLVTFIIPVFDAAARAFFAFTLLLPRFGRFVVHRANAFTHDTREKDEMLKFVNCEGVPVRSTVEGLAFLFACAGVLDLVIGGLTNLQQSRISFLEPGLPGNVEKIAFGGVAMICTALAAWLVAYLSPHSNAVLATIGGLGIFGLIIASLVGASSTSAHNLRSWKTSIELGRNSFFSDAGLVEHAKIAQALLDRFDLDNSGKLESYESSMMLLELHGREATEAQAYMSLLDDWNEMRTEFESIYSDCQPTVYNSTRVRQACRAEEERREREHEAEEEKALEAERLKEREAAEARIRKRWWIHQEVLDGEASRKTALQQAHEGNGEQASPPFYSCRELSFAKAFCEPAMAALDSVWEGTKAVGTSLLQVFTGYANVLGRYAQDAFDGITSMAEMISDWIPDFFGEGLKDTDQSVLKPHREVCTIVPPPDRFVLYCSGGYLIRHGHVAAWHGNGLASHPGRFDALASRWCLDEPVAVLLARMATDSYRACANSSWWPSPPLTLSTPLDELSASSSALGEGAPARKVFEALGKGDVPLSPKALFCLCEGSSEYVGLLDSYTETLTWASWPFTFWAPFFLLAVAPLTLCIYMFCPIFGRLEDTSRYYDKDLL